MEPTTLLPVISLLLLVSVEYGGWSLLGLLTGRGQLGEFHEQFFRAGHAHTGVPFRPRAEEPKLSGNDRNTNRRPAPCGGADRLGHRPTLVKDG
jgi:hypothetical protein